MLLLGTVGSGQDLLLLVEAILCRAVVSGLLREVPRGMYSLQKLRRMRAALSLSLSSVVGQKASEPSLFDSLLTGAPSLSAHPHSLSKPDLLVCLVRCHMTAGPGAAGAGVRLCSSYEGRAVRLWIYIRGGRGNAGLCGRNGSEGNGLHRMRDSCSCRDGMASQRLTLANPSRAA